MSNKFIVKIPNGYLMVEEKGVESEIHGRNYREEG